MKILNYLSALLYAAALIAGVLYISLQKDLFLVLLLASLIAGSALLLGLSLYRLFSQKRQKEKGVRKDEETKSDPSRQDREMKP